jgi:uncharacterized membrane protein YeaQ/YmgE (transglycosylase-associated protein family)
MLSTHWVEHGSLHMHPNAGAADNLRSGVRGDVHRFFRIAAGRSCPKHPEASSPGRGRIRFIDPAGEPIGHGRQSRRPQARRGCGRRNMRSEEKSEGTMSGESLLVILLVGLIAGWLAGQIVRGTGFGLVADLCLGIIGAFIGDWLLPRLGIHLGSGILAAIIAATIGAVLLLVILRLVHRRGRW